VKISHFTHDRKCEEVVSLQLSNLMDDARPEQKRRRKQASTLSKKKFYCTGTTITPTTKQTYSQWRSMG